jgi:hypothetical protein
MVPRAESSARYPTQLGTIVLTAVQRAVNFFFGLLIAGISLRATGLRPSPDEPVSLQGNPTGIFPESAA